jgi:hypothetical protein
MIMMQTTTSVKHMNIKSWCCKSTLLSMRRSCRLSNWWNWKEQDVPYILEANPHSVLGDFLNGKKLVCDCNECIILDLTKTGINCIVFFLWHMEQLYHFSQIQLLTANLTAGDSNPHLNFQSSKTVKRVPIRFKNTVHSFFTMSRLDLQPTQCPL